MGTRTRERITCSHCDAPWDARVARFCGACGHVLTAPAPSPAERPRRRHGIKIAAAVAAGTLALTAAVAASLDLRLPTRAPDPSVALADEDGVPRGRPVSPELRETLLAPFDPDRLRCEPAGCERWRVDLDSSGAWGTAFGDLVVAMTDGEVIAFDTATGEEVWRTPVAGVGDARALVPSSTDQYLAVAAGANPDVQIIDHEGAVRGWDTAPRGRLTGAMFIGDEVFVMSTTATQLSYGGGSSTEPRDVQERTDAWAADGNHLWTREQSGVFTVTDDAVVLRTGDGALLVDARTGEERGRDTLLADAWLHADGGLVFEHGATPQGTRLRSGEDLRVLPVSEELRQVWPVEGHGLAVGVRRPPPAGTTEADDTPASTLVLIDDQGAILWEADAHPILTTYCCPRALVDGDMLLVVTATVTGGEGPVRRSLTTGAEVTPPPDHPPHPVLPDGAWWITAHTALQHSDASVGDGAVTREQLVVLHEDTSVTIAGSAWLVRDEPPFVVSNGRTLLGVEPVGPAG